MRLMTLLRKDAKVILRSRLLLVTLIVYPLVIVGIIGFAFSQPNSRFPVAVLNEDVDAQGQPLRGHIANPLDPSDPGIEVSTGQLIYGDPDEGIPGLAALADVRPVKSLDEGDRLLRRGEVQALVVFPRGFVDDLTRFVQSGTVRVFVDQSDIVRASITEVLIRGVIQEVQERYVEQKVAYVQEAIQQSLSPVPGDRLYPGFRGSIQRLHELEDDGNLNAEQVARLNETIRFLREVEQVLGSSEQIVHSVAQPVFVDVQHVESGHLFVRDLIVPAALGLSIFWTGSLATSSLIVYEREAQAYRRLGVTPTSRATVTGSKVLLTSGIIFAQSLFILIAARVAWDTRIDNVPLTILIVVLSTFASIGLGIFLSGVSRDVNGTVLLAVLTTFPMLFLSGLFYPVSFMPAGAQVLAGAFPLTYTVEGLRASMLRAAYLSDTALEVVALVLFGVGLTVVGMILGRIAERRT